MGKPRKKSKVYRVRSARVRRNDEQEHYVDPLTNLKDGLDQERRRKLEVTPPVEPTRVEPVTEAKFWSELEATGGEKLPGMGTMGHYDVSAAGVSNGALRGALGLTKEEFEIRRLRFHEERWYWRSSGKGERKRAWPGLLRHTLTFAPWFDRTIKRALREGAVGAPAFEEFLRRLLAELPAVIEEATRFGGARRGVETLLVMTHYQQGVVHLHPYVSDVGADHERVGHFQGGKKPRLVLAGLGPSGVGADRQERLGLLPTPRLDKEENIIADWQPLKWNIADRARRMGDEGRLPWDVVVSRWLDERLDGWARANPAVSRILAEEIAEERRANLVAVSLRREELRLEAAEEAEKKAEAAKAEAARIAADAAKREAAVVEREAAVDLADRLLTAEAVKLDRAEAVVDERFSEAQRQEREAADVQRRAMQLLAEAEAKRKAAEEQMAATQRAADVTNARLTTQEEKLAIEVRRAAVADMELRNEHVRAVQAANAAHAAIVSRAVHADFAHLLVQFWTRDRLNRLLVACQAIVTCKAKPIPDDLTFAFESQDGRTKVTAYNLSSQTRRDLAALCELSRSAGNRLVVEDVERIFKTAEVFDLVLPSMATIKLFREACELLCDGKPITQAHADVVSDEGLRAAIMAYSTPRLSQWKKQLQFGIVNPVLDLLDWLGELTKVEMKRRKREQSRGLAMQLAEESGASNAVGFEEPQSKVVGDEEFDRG